MKLFYSGNIYGKIRSCSHVNAALPGPGMGICQSARREVVNEAGGVRVMVLCFRLEAHRMGKNKDRGSRQSSRQ